MPRRAAQRRQSASSGRSPVEQFLDSLSDGDAAAVLAGMPRHETVAWRRRAISKGISGKSYSHSDRTVAIFRVIGSPGFEFDGIGVRERAALSYDRGDDPLGVARRLLAVFASGDRTARLASVSTPTLVIHGTSDPLIDVSGGRATAQAVPDAQLVTIDGMGHDLPRALWPLIATRIAALVAAAEADPVPVRD